MCCVLVLTHPRATFDTQLKPSMNLNFLVTVNTIYPPPCVVRTKVVGCVVRTCDVSKYPPKLSLSLDVAGKTEQIDGAMSDQVI